jgi:hypothetical protein
MRPITQLEHQSPAPRTIAADPLGRKFIMRAMYYMLLVNNVSVEANNNLMSVDGGSNNGMDGDGMQ